MCIRGTQAHPTGYPTGWAQQSIPQYCGILFCNRMQPMGPRAAIYPAILRTSNLQQNAVIGPLVAEYYSATECSQWVRAPRRGYPTGWAQQSIPQYCGILFCCILLRILFCNRMQPMGPRAAERLSYRMGAAIYPAILRNINLLQNAVIGPLVADIVLQQNAANGPARRGEANN